MTNTVTEIVYGHVLTAIASGASRNDTLVWIADRYGSQSLKPGELSAIMDEALVDALSVGVEVEDIDPSWI